MPEEQSTIFYFAIEVTGEKAAEKAAELQEKLTKALTESVKPTKSLAEAFGELDKRIAGTNERIRQLIKMFPSQMKEMEGGVRKALLVVSKAFEDLSYDVAGGSIVPDMIAKVLAEYTKMEVKSGKVTEAMKEHVEVLKKAFAEVYTIPWSEDVERMFKGLADKLLAGSENTVRAITDSLEKMQMAFGAGVTAVPGAVPVAPPVEVETFAQRMAAWSKDFTDAVQEASIGTWGLRRMGFMFQQLGRSMEQSGKQIISTLKSMVESYLEFNGVMAKTGASIGLTADATADLSDEVVKAAKAVGFISPEKIATGFDRYAQSVGASVDTEEERNKVLTQSLQITKLAELRNADLGNTIDTVSGIMNVFNMDVSEFDSALAQMNYAAAKSSVNLGDFGSMLQYVGPIAVDMGMTFRDLIAVTLLLAKANIRGNSAMTAMRSIFQSIAEPSAKFTKAMNNLVGVTEQAADVGYSWLDEFGGRLPTIAEYVRLVAREIVNLTDAERAQFYAATTNQRSYAALIAMVSAQVKAQAEGGADAFQEAMVSNQEALSFMERAWSEYEKQDSVRAQKMKQRWDEVGRSIGKSLVEAGIEPAERASELLESLSELLEKYPGLITGAAGVGVGAVGIGKLLALVGQLLQIMVMYKMLAAVAPGMLGALGTAGLVAAPVALVGGVLASAAINRARLAIAGTEEAREFFEREFAVRDIPVPAQIGAAPGIVPLTPLARQILGGPEELYTVERYEQLLDKIVGHLNRMQGPTIGIRERGLFAGEPLPALPPVGGITTEAGEFIPPGAVEDFESRMFEFVEDMKEIEDTYRHDSIRLTEQTRERKLAVIAAYDDREVAAELSLTRQLATIAMNAGASKRRAMASHEIRMEQMQASHHKALIRAEEDFVRQMARAADDYARSEARAQEDFDAQRGKSRKQFQDNEARDAERFALKMERLEKDHADKLRGVIRERDARGFIEEMLSYARRKTEAQEDYDIRRRDARSSFAEQEADAQANFDKARRRAQEDYDRQRRLAKEQYEFARARRIADYEDQRKLMAAALVEQLRLIEESARDQRTAAENAAKLAAGDRDIAEEKELESIDDNATEQLRKLRGALRDQRGELRYHFWGPEGMREMRDQYTEDEYDAIVEAHEDEMYFYNNTVIPDTKTVWGKIFKIAKDYTEKIARERAKAQADWQLIANMKAQTLGTTGTPKQLGGYASYGTYRLGETGREFILSNMTTRALERRVGTLSQGAMLRLGGNGSGNRAPISVILRQENWQFAGALSAAEKNELREMARIGALEAFDEVTQKAWD